MSWRARPLEAASGVPHRAMPCGAASQAMSMPVPSASMRHGSAASEELSAGVNAPLTGTTAAPDDSVSTTFLSLARPQREGRWKRPLPQFPTVGAPEVNCHARGPRQDVLPVPCQWVSHLADARRKLSRNHSVVGVEQVLLARRSHVTNHAGPFV